MADQKFIYNASGDVISTLHVHETVDGSTEVTFARTENVDPILDFVRAARDATTTKKTHWRVVSHFPDSFLDQALREGWANDPKEWRKKHNDPDNAAFRIADIRV